MSDSVSPSVTAQDLLALKAQLGTWAAVGRQLAITSDQLMRLRQRLGCYTYDDLDRKKPSSLDAFAEQIIECNAQGMTCPEIVEALSLSVKDEAVRRWLDRRGIPRAAKRGAQPGAKNWAWKGGRIVDKHGYILIYKPDHPHANSNGYVREHRLVMEEMIGRYLKPEEVVHHIDGNKANNHPDNLGLFDNNPLHISVTLKGQKPNWTEEGYQRILEGIEKSVRVRQHSAQTLAPMPTD